MSAMDWCTTPRASLTLAALALVACGGDSGSSDAQRVRAPPATEGEFAGPPPSALDSLFAAADELYDAWAMDSARVLFTAALERSRAAADPAAEARALTSLGLSAWRLGEYAEARRVGHSALELKLRHGLYEQLFRSYNALGLLAWNESRYHDALDLYRLAQEVAEAAADTVNLSKVWSNLGNIHTDLGEFSTARPLFERALDAARQPVVREADPRIEGRVLTNLGMLAVRTGDPASAIPHLREAVGVLQEAEDPYGEQAAVAHLGTAYAGIGEPGRAIAHLDSALVEVRARGHRQEEASNLEQLAELFLAAGDYPRALRLLEEAKSINAELDLLDETGADLRSEAAIHAQLGNLDLAERSAREALDIHREVGARLEVVGDLLMLAELSHQTGVRGDATAFLREARELASALEAPKARAAVALSAARIANRDADARSTLAELHAAASDIALAGSDYEWEAHALAARAFRNVGALDSAAAAGRRAVAAIERVRGQFGSGALRTSYAAGRAEAYHDLVDILLRLGRVDEAFEVADGSRGRALLEHLATRGENGASSGGVSLRQLAEEERQLLASIDTLTVYIEETRLASDAEAEASQREELDRLYDELERKRGEYAAALVRAEERKPEQLALVGVRRPRAADVQAALRPGEILLQYMVLPERVLLFVVGSDSVHVVTSQVSHGRLAAQVRVARELLGRPAPEPDGGGSAAEALFDMLLRPALESGAVDGADVLVVVPDGELTYLPFAALRDRKTGQYLAEDYAVMHLPSAGSLPALRSRTWDTPGAAPSLAVAFAPYPDRLPASAAEAEAFRETVGGAEIHRGRRATEARFRQALSGARIVHAATHGILNARSPVFSRLELARDDGSGPDDDGRLEVHEIVDAVVRASLVFLSGCETGVGAAWATGFSRGEDYATLARAFLYAGADNVIATLWRVEDDGAAAFAAVFYRELDWSSGAGVGPPAHGLAEALARAQRAMVGDPRYAAPYYWAGYRLSGTGQMRAARLAVSPAWPVTQETGLPSVPRNDQTIPMWRLP